MSYIYKNLCFSDVTAIYSMMAADCPPVASDGLPLQCSPLINGYSVTHNGITQNVIFTPDTCTPEYTDASLLAGAILAVLFVAWSFKTLTKVL
jgi:hypothetical protein